MSNPYVNSDGRAESLNQTAAHDAALYDPAVHDNQIVAVYETDAAANAARDALIGAGIPRAAIEVVDRSYGDAAGPSSAEDRNQGGFLGAIKSLFVPSEDVSTGYGEAHRPGARDAGPDPGCDDGPASGDPGAGGVRTRSTSTPSSRNGGRPGMTRCRRPGGASRSRPEPADRRTPATARAGARRCPVRAGCAAT